MSKGFLMCRIKFMSGLLRGIETTAEVYRPVVGEERKPVCGGSTYIILEIVG